MSGKDSYETGHNNMSHHRGIGPGFGRPRMSGGEKPKDFRKSISKLMLHAKKYLPVLISAIILSMMAGATTLAGPDMLRAITDTITAGLNTGIDLDRVVRLCVILLLIFSFGAILRYVQGRILTTATQRFAQGLRTDISEKVNRLPLKYFDNTTYGDILSRVTNDVDTITTALNHSIGNLTISATLMLGSLVLMLVTNALLAAVAVVSTLAGLIIMSLIMKSSQKFFMRNQKNLGALNGHVEEIYSGHNVVMAYNAGREATAAFDHINDKLLDSNWKSQFLSGLMMPLTFFVGNFGYVAVCAAGAVLAVEGRISFGVIIAFIVHIRNFTHPLSAIAQSMTALQSAAAASERVFEMLEEEEMPDESGLALTQGEVEGLVEFDKIVFGYESGKTVIKEFSAVIHPGQKVAIVGPTGAGKTTLVNLLMRFYETDSGEIRIDGKPISQISRESVHSLFCMVLQDTWLFEGTLKENVAYNKKGVSDDEVKEACKAVGLHHFIRTLPHGYDTVLGDNVTLSAGQKQLLTIARAMVENAPLLIFDEATSSVDTRTEALVQQAMDELTKGRTSFVIAHRLSTIRNADLIIVMRDGDIVESGRHEDLVASNGFYAELYNSQFDRAS